MKKVTVVIPNFNGKELLAQNLPKLLRFFPKSEIIVVDDGSEDGSTAFLQKEFLQIKILANQKNLGFASTANKGIRAAKSNLVFLLNNDCYPERDFISVILPYFKDKKTFAVGCLEKFNHKKRGRGIGGFKKGLFFHRAGKPDKNNTLWTFGASTFYNRKIFKKLDGFDENFNPFYWEDFDLSYRALKAGYKIYFEKRAVVYHQESSTIKKYYSQFKVQAIGFRNQLLTCWKNMTDKKLIINHFLWLPYHLIWTSLKSRGAFLVGFLMALLRLPKVLKMRRLTKQSFKISDREVLEPFQKELST